MPPVNKDSTTVVGVRAGVWGNDAGMKDADTVLKADGGGGGSIFWSCVIACVVRTFFA